MNFKELRIIGGWVLTVFQTPVLSGVPRGCLGGSNPPPPKFRRLSKIVPNSTRLWKLLEIDEVRKPTPLDVRKKGSKILKLPPFRNCFTLAMTNKLVVIISSLKVPKIKKIVLYEMKYLVPNYSCLQNPWLGATAPRSPFSLSSTEFVVPSPPEQSSWVRHCLFCTLSASLLSFFATFRHGMFFSLVSWHM